MCLRRCQQVLVAPRVMNWPASAVHGMPASFTRRPASAQTARRDGKDSLPPDEQKDGNYWLKRTRNNEAAKRSRQRKRMEEHHLESRAVALQRENDKLKAALSAVHHHHSTAQSNPMDAAFGFPLGLPSDYYPRSLAVPTTVLPLRSLPYCQFSGCCGTICPETNLFRSVSI